MLKHCKLSKILQPLLLTTPFWDSLCRRVNLVLQRKDLLQLCTERKLNIFWLDFKKSSRWKSESFKFRIRRNICIGINHRGISLQLHCHSKAKIRWHAQMKPLWCQSKINKNTFQWDAYCPLTDHIPACTAQEGCVYPSMH